MVYGINKAAKIVNPQKQKQNGPFQILCLRNVSKRSAMKWGSVKIKLNSLQTDSIIRLFCFAISQRRARKMFIITLFQANHY